MRDKLILCGPYASGKTTLGKRLAARLGWAFLDEPPNARDLHIRLGEEAFREQEESHLRESLAQSQAVIATGGGCVVSERSRRVLQGVFPVVLLDVEQEELWHRWQKRGHPHFAPTRLAFESYLSVRLPLYQEVADVVLCANNLEGAFWAATALADTLRSPLGENLTAKR